MSPAHAEYVRCLKSWTGTAIECETWDKEGQWMTLFKCRSGSPILFKPCSQKNLKGSLIEALVDFSSVRKRRAENELFQYHGYDYMLSHGSSKSEEYVRWKAEQIDTVKKRLLRKGKKKRLHKDRMVEKMWRRVLSFIKGKCNEFVRHARRDYQKSIGRATRKTRSAVWKLGCFGCSLHVPSLHSL